MIPRVATRVGSQGHGELAPHVGIGVLHGAPQSLAQREVPEHVRGHRAHVALRVVERLLEHGLDGPAVRGPLQHRHRVLDQVRVAADQTARQGPLQGRRQGVALGDDRDLRQALPTHQRVVGQPAEHLEPHRLHQARRVTDADRLPGALVLEHFCVVHGAQDALAPEEAALVEAVEDQLGAAHLAQAQQHEQRVRAGVGREAVQVPQDAFLDRGHRARPDVEHQVRCADLEGVAHRLLDTLRRRLPLLASLEPVAQLHETRVRRVPALQRERLRIRGHELVVARALLHGRRQEQLVGGRDRRLGLPVLRQVLRARLGDRHQHLHAILVAGRPGGPDPQVDELRLGLLGVAVHVRDQLDLLQVPQQVEGHLAGIGATGAGPGAGPVADRLADDARRLVEGALLARPHQAALCADRLGAGRLGTHGGGGGGRRVLRRSGGGVGAGHQGDQEQGEQRAGDHGSILRSWVLGCGGSRDFPRRRSRPPDCVTGRSRARQRLVNARDPAAGGPRAYSPRLTKR